MKKLAIGTLVAVLAVGAASFALAGPYGPGPYVQQAQGYGWGYGPMHMGPMMGGPYGTGPGMMGWGHGPGMMGWGSGPGCWGGWGAGYAPASQPLTRESATQILQNYVSNTGNPNLKLGDVAETPTTVEGKVVTKDGSLVETVVVEKATGRMYSTF